MSEYTDAVLAKFPNVSAAIRKALADALAAAEKAQQSKPGSTPVGVSTLPKTGAQASEDDSRDAVAELLRLAEDIHRRNSSISLESAARVALYGDADLRRRVREAPATKRLPAGARDAAHYLEGKAATALRPDEQLAAAADALMLSEDFTGDYGAAIDKSVADDPALAELYASRHVFGATAAKLPPLPIPRGYRLITKPADAELAERAEARAAADRCALGEAMALVVAEDEALASRYADYTSGFSALDELAGRVETIQTAARGRDHITPAKAVSMALAEDPVLKDGVFCYFERA